MRAFLSRSIPSPGWWTTLAVVAMLLALDLWTMPPDAVSQVDASSAAGLVIDSGEGEPGYVVVTFAEPTMTAIDTLRAADLEVVTVEFGGLGEGVCSIVRTGCDVSSCRQRLCQTGDPESPFWQYWELGDDGAWSLSSRGASHAQVEDGDIGAWVWTGTAPELDPIGWDELASRAGAPDSVVAGHVSGPPAVYSEALDGTGSDAEGSGASTLGAVGVVAMVGLAGAWIVVRQRRHLRTET